MPAPSPRQRRKAKNKDAILDVAADLIVRKGIENVSLREIAREADYSPAALYKYFESKAALLRSLLARENQKLLHQLTSLPVQLSPAGRLVESCLIYIRYNQANPAYPSLVNTLPSGRTSRDQPISENSPFAVFLEEVKNWVRVDPVQLSDSYGSEEITYALWALTHGMATLRLNQLRSFEADFDTINRRTLEIYLNGLLP